MAEEDDAKSLIPTGGDVAFEAMRAAAASSIPVLGGAILAVADGVGRKRQMERVAEVFQRLADRVQTLEEKQADYVRSDEFEDLLHRAVTQAANERSEEKRRLYVDFLTGAIQLAGEDPFDDQVRFLRTLELLLPAQLRLLAAIRQDPPEQPTYYATSPHQILADRTGWSKDRVNEVIEQLQDLKIVAGLQGGVMMTGAGAEDMRGALTPYGRRFLTYLERGKS